ncbi:MAG: hypothetical protein ACK4IK_09605 [Bacteroidia bacterium]
MARKPNKIDKNTIEKLKEEVSKTFAKPILNPIDCDKLSDDIFSKTKHYISSSTLKRFWGFHHINFYPSYQTLNILSAYCGFDGFHNFNFNKKEKSIISEADIKLLNEIFNETDYLSIKDLKEYDESMQLITRKVALKLRENPKYFESCIKDLAKNKLAQIFYFEHFPDYDILVEYQFKAYEEYLKHKNTCEAKVFGNSLLFFRGFLLEDKILMKKYYKILSSINLEENIHPMAIGRLYKCFLLYNTYVENKESKDLIKHIFSIEKKMPRVGLHFTNFPGFHYFVADGLILCNYNKEAIKLITKAFENYNITREFVWKGYYRQLQLMLAEAYYNIGEKEKSEKLISKINPESFYFITRNYFRTRYLILKYKVSKNIKYKKEAINRINESHFNVLLRLLK